MLALLLAWAIAQETVDSPLLRVGETIEGEIVDGDAEVHTPTLDTDYADAPVVGKSFLIAIEEPGPYTIELVSHLFDAYLVLRDNEGRVLVEDDDGLLSTHSRIVREMEPYRSLQVETCALHGEVGPFQVHLFKGRPPELSALERDSAEIVDQRRRVEAIEGFKGPESAALATALNALGFLYWQRDAFHEAKPLMERALAIREKTLGPEHVDTALSLNNLAAQLKGLGDYNDAQRLYERSLAIRESALGQAHPYTASSLHDLSVLLWLKGDYSAAQRFCERALEIRESALGPEHLETGACLDTLAILHWAQGDYSSARPLFERAFAIVNKVLGRDHPHAAACLNNLALLLLAQADYSAARPLLERAVAISEGVPGSGGSSVAIYLNNLASLLLSQGDYVAAQPLLERGLAISEKILGPDHPQTALSLSNLAELLMIRGNYSGARPLYESALEIQERALEPAHPHTLASLNNLALLLQAQGDYSAAQLLFERALAIGEKTHGSAHPSTAASLNNLARLLLIKGDYILAQAYCSRSLSINESVFGSEHPKTVMSLANLAIVLADIREPSAACDTAARAWKASRSHQQQMLASLSEAESYAYLATVRGVLQTLLSLAPLVSSSTLMIYEPVLAWKGQVSRQLLGSRERLFASLGEEERVLVKGLRSCQSQLSQLALIKDTADRSLCEERLVDLRNKRNDIERELLRSGKGEEVQDVSFQDLRASLPRYSALVDFLIHQVYRPAQWEGEELVDAGGCQEPRVSAWISKPEQDEPVWLDLGPASDLEGAVRVFLEDLVSRRGVASASTGEGDSPAARLRELLWDPIAPLLEGVRTVFVSPDTFFGTLPLETLSLADGSFLVERFSIVYLQDPTSLVRMKTRDASLQSLLCAGGIDYKRRAEWKEERGIVAATSDLRGGFQDHWHPLRSTGPETDFVASLHAGLFSAGDHLLLQGAEATEERLKHELPRHSIVHLATHGFFNPEGIPSLWEAALKEAQKEGPQLSEENRVLAGKHPGLLTGLVCAGANAEPEAGRDDGYLTAEEVGWLDLSRVELIVLSACETGLGRAQSGEGLLGLRRAFEMAGAKTVISSLWSVKDESTARLMQGFYTNLWQRKMGRGEALRAAQLEMLARNRAEHGDALPSTWGAFVLSGEWR